MSPLTRRLHAEYVPFNNSIAVSSHSQYLRTQTNFSCARMYCDHASWLVCCACARDFSKTRSTRCVARVKSNCTIFIIKFVINVKNHQNKKLFLNGFSHALPMSWEVDVCLCSSLEIQDGSIGVARAQGAEAGTPR